MRAVYMNDPVPTVPGHFMGFRHIGTEIHFYGCQNDYLAYPIFTEDTPTTNLFASEDHEGYFCLVQAAETLKEKVEDFIEEVLGFLQE